MKHLVALMCGVAVIVIAFKQPWLINSGFAGYAEMAGDGTWTSARQPLPLRGVPDGMPLQWGAVVGGAFILFGVVSDRPGRTLFGAAVAGGTAAFAMWATETVSRIPKEHIYMAALEAGTAPKAILAAAVVAGIAALMTPVPTNTAPATAQADNA